MGILTRGWALPSGAKRWHLFTLQHGCWHSICGRWGCDGSTLAPQREAPPHLAPCADCYRRENEEARAALEAQRPRVTTFLCGRGSRQDAPRRGGLDFDAILKDPQRHNYAASERGNPATPCKACGRPQGEHRR